LDAINEPPAKAKFYKMKLMLYSVSTAKVHNKLQAAAME